MLNTVHETYGRADLTVGGAPVAVHAFRCGSVTVKRCHMIGCLPETAPAGLRFAAILADRRFADPMPIWAYVVEHPDATVVVDTGADPSYNDPASWSGHDGTRRLLQSFIRLAVQSGEALPAAMRRAHLDPDRVATVVLTHQHIDHTGTVPAFRDADVWTTAAEDRAARLIGAEQWRWRGGARFRHVDAEGTGRDVGTAVDLTPDGALIAIHTPGHTPGSVSVRLASDQGEIWFTGDTSFTARAMDPSAPTAGIHTDVAAVRRLQARLRGRGVLLPSHDPDVPARLAAVSAR